MSPWTYPLAHQLAAITTTYGFDGWLVNIEKTFPALRWSAERLTGFLEQLKSLVGDGNVIWYDALDVHNRINYQNGLTAENVVFAKAAGSILTNYAWTCLLYTSPSPRDRTRSRMPSSA